MKRVMGVEEHAHIKSGLCSAHSLMVCVHACVRIWMLLPLSAHVCVCEERQLGPILGRTSNKTVCQINSSSFQCEMLKERGKCAHIDCSLSIICRHTHTHTHTRTLPFLSNPHKWQWMAECKWAGYYTATFIKLSWKDFNGPDEYACKFVN